MTANQEKLLSFFQELLYIRLVEEKICDLYPGQEMRCPVHISIGQEATAVGVCLNITSQDMVFSNHRSHGHYLAKGGDLDRFFAELYGKNSGCSKGRGGSMHLVDLSVGFMGATAIVSGTIPVAVGAALTLSIKNARDIVVVFLGDGAVEEGVFYESINFTKLKNLPILFFCENNFYSVYSHINDRQPKRKIIDLAKCHGVDCYEVDGNDVIDVYETTGQAITKIRNGGGPAFIEAATYRWREHCGPNFDNNIGYRTEEEFLSWKRNDPINQLKEKLLANNILNPDKIAVITEMINKKIDEAVKFAKSSPYPDKSELNKYIYAE